MLSVYLYLICLLSSYSTTASCQIGTCTCNRGFLNSERAFNRSSRFVIADRRRTDSRYTYSPFTRDVVQLHYTYRSSGDLVSTAASVLAKNTVQYRCALP